MRNIVMKAGGWAASPGMLRRRFTRSGHYGRNGLEGFERSQEEADEELVASLFHPDLTSEERESVLGEIGRAAIAEERAEVEQVAAGLREALIWKLSQGREERIRARQEAWLHQLNGFAARKPTRSTKRQETFT